MRIVGIDAGGTKTDFLLCDENENQIRRVTLGAGNPNDIGIDACLELLSDGLDELCADGAPDKIFAGVSGGGFGENAEHIRSFLAARYPLARVENGADMINLIYCSRSSGNVGALICGTGTALFLRKDREILRFGGWGQLFDGGGSAYDFGRDAVRFLLYCEENDPQALKSPLCAILTRELGSSAHDALGKLYAKGKSYIASFAPAVFEAYEQGDETAERIIDSNVQILASRLERLSKAHADIDEIVCGGGLFKSDIFFERLSKKSATVLVRPSVPPVVGACRKAMEI